MPKSPSKTLAVIPARGASKGIPRKNLMMCGGVSLLERAIQFSLAMGLDTVVTTEDDEVEKISKNYAIKIVKTQGNYLHSDECKSLDVWLDAWDREVYSQSVLLEPTSPLRQPADVIECLSLLPLNSSVMTVSETYPPQKSFMLDGKIVKTDPKRRQDCLPHYRANGLCYAMRADHTGEITHDARAVITTRPVANIDTMSDLEYAEFLISIACAGLPDTDRTPHNQSRLA